MRTLILTAEEYTLLQQVFVEHFQRTEQYLERLTDAIVRLSTAMLDVAPHERRNYVQKNAPEYLFQKRGMAGDKALLEEIRQSLRVQRTIPIPAVDFYHVLILVVGALTRFAPALETLHTKMEEILAQPLAHDEKVVLVLRVDFTTSV